MCAVAYAVAGGGAGAGSVAAWYCGSGVAPRRGADDGTTDEFWIRFILRFTRGVATAGACAASG